MFLNLEISRTSSIFLLDQKKILIIHEFQNILGIDNSIYGEIQNIIDERKI